MGGGNIILLNGTSSAGKTTIAQALQEVMEAPYLLTGIDQFLMEHLPKRLVVYSDGVAPQAADGWLAIFCDDALAEMRIGPLGYQWLAGMYRAIAAFAGAGLDVIMDDVIYDERVLSLAVDILPAERVFFVGIRCPLEVAEHREIERGNRARGGARTFHPLVHRHAVYDCEVDSGANTPHGCAREIQRQLNAHSGIRAFMHLRNNGNITPHSA
jgi:chloramphenicol 3-O phosphotransferase